MQLVEVTLAGLHAAVDVGNARDAPHGEGRLGARLDQAALRLAEPAIERFRGVDGADGAAGPGCGRRGQQVCQSVPRGGARGDDRLQLAG